MHKAIQKHVQSSSKTNIIRNIWNRGIDLNVKQQTLLPVFPRNEMINNKMELNANQS